MSGSISDFLGSLGKTGVSKTSHFDVFIASAGHELSKTIAFRCEAAEIPGRQLAVSENKIYGPTYKIPHQSVYAETSMRFIETANLDIRRFFETWMNLIWDSETNRMQYPVEWNKEIRLTQYDMVADSKENRNLKPTLVCKFNEAFPINVNQMPTEWSDDGFHRVQVTFAYRSYSIDGQLKLQERPGVDVGPVTVEE